MGGGQNYGNDCTGHHKYDKVQHLIKSLLLTTATCQLIGQIWVFWQLTLKPPVSVSKMSLKYNFIQTWALLENAICPLELYDIAYMPGAVL